MEKLGIQLPLLLTQTVNFLIMLVILTKLLYKPMLKSLKERRRKIEEGLAFAEKAKLEEEKMAKRKEEMLKDTRDEIRVMLEDAKKDAKKVKEEILAEGKQEVAVLKERMEKELLAREETMQKEVVGHTIDVASEMVKRLLPEVMSDKEQHRLITKQLQSMNKSHGRS